MIDPDRFAELEAEIGLEDLGFIVTIYLQEAEETLDRIAAGLPAEEHVRALHFLRSGALNIGLRAIAAVSGELEDAESDDAPEAVKRLRALLAKSRVELGEVLDVA